MGTIQIGNVRGKIVEDISDPEIARYLFISIPFALQTTAPSWYLSIAMSPWPMSQEWRLRIERYGASFVDLCEL
jgi:hypothetical protein